MTVLISLVNLIIKWCDTLQASSCHYSSSHHSWDQIPRASHLAGTVFPALRADTFTLATVLFLHLIIHTKSLDEAVKVTHGTALLFSSY